MKSNVILKLLAIGGIALALFAALLLTPGSKHGTVSATANAPAPLLSCPIVSGNSTGAVSAVDILLVVRHFGQNYGQPGAVYWPLYDLVGPYDPANPSITGKITAVDILAVVTKFAQHCPLVDIQIAKATRAIGDPQFSDVLCDPTFTNAVNCGGNTSFLTEDPTFLASKGYRRGSTDVPGQGIHYVNFDLWNGVFNPARPPGLVYKNGVLVAQLYYAAGDSNATIGGTAGVGWGSNQSSDLRGVNTDAFCTPVAQEPPGTGCSWDGSHDGFHWHQNLCTLDIGTTSAIAIPGFSQSSCTTFGGTGTGQWNHSTGVTCTWYPNPGWNCTWAPAVGWMGHLWNWLPNPNYTLGASPGPTCVDCASFENNGRFADCSPDTNNWTAYNCPQ